VRERWKTPFPDPCPTASSQLSAQFSSYALRRVYRGVVCRENREMLAFTLIHVATFMTPYSAHPH
jgi:hypothetical protein